MAGPRETWNPCENDELFQEHLQNIRKNIVQEHAMNQAELMVDQFRRMSSCAVASVMFGTSAMIVATVPFLGVFAAVPLALIGLGLAVTAIRVAMAWHFPVGLPIVGGLLSVAAFGILVAMAVVTAAWSRSVPSDHGVLHSAVVTVSASQAG